MNQWILRKAVPDDKPRIAELFIEMLKTIYCCEEAEGYQEGQLDKFFGSGGDWICIAEENGEAIGYLSIEEHHEKGDYLYLDDFSVHEKYRSQGIGTAMIAAAEEYAIKKNISEIYLHVEKANSRARCLYERLGFRVTNDEGTRFLMRKDFVIVTFLQATQNDTDFLRNLAYESEAYWSYDRIFMEKFNQDFNITCRFIKMNPVYIAVVDKKIIAFWGLKQNEDSWELEYFYIATKHMGKGYGRHMWSHLITWCRSHGITTFHFVTSPQAAGFYEKMGAVQDKVAASIIDGRPIPHFVYSINWD